MTPNDPKVRAALKCPDKNNKMTFLKASKFIDYDVYNAFGSKLHVKYQRSICLVL